MSGSRIYKKISKQDIDKIITDLYGSNGRLISYETLNGGLFNTTYFLHTDQEKDGLVLRVGPVNKHLLFNFEKDMMSAEPFIHKLLRDNGIPTSNILKYSPENSVIDRDYTIVEYIKSVPMNDKSLENTDLSYVYEDIGRLTKRMHGITNKKFGWFRNTEWGLYDKWSDFISAFAAEAADKAEEYNLYSINDIEKLRTIVAENRLVLDKITVPNFMHSDLWQGNILLSKDKDTYKVAAIIDLDRTIFGDKYWDFSTLWVINDPFLKGYNENTEKTGEYEMRQNIYKLINSFFCSYVYQIEYDNIERFNREKENTSSLFSAYSNLV